MRVLPAPAALLLLAIIALLGSADAVRAQEEGGGGAADSTAAAPADTTEARRFLSADGAVEVYEEAVPGEGIEGFWWEYDPEADLARLLDRDRRAQDLEPLTDAFGFDLVIPDSILALRDSVTTVADSILASRIEFETSFDPKVKSKYTERRDDYELVNEVTSPIPLTTRTTLTTSLKDTQRYNQSTSKLRGDRDLSSTFTFRYSEKISTTLTATRTQSQQKRGSTLENETANTAVNGRAQAYLNNDILGTVELTTGLRASAVNYQTTRTEGESGSFEPTWGMKITRPFTGGSTSLDYNGSLSRGTRKETRPELVMQEDSTFVEQDLTVETNDSNRNDKVSLTSTYKVAEGWDLRLNSGAGRVVVQYIAQSDSIAGRQETRTGADGNARLQLDAKPVPGLEVRSGASITARKTEYDLETAKFANTTRKTADTEFRYDVWPGANIITKLTRDHEDKKFRTAQTGTVDKQSASLDYKQKVTDHVDLTTNLFMGLDSFAFEDTEANTGDRDLLTQRGTATVRYTPRAMFSTSIKMDLRETQSVNIHPTRSGDNKTDFTYLISPGYTLKIGSANITGDFTADARYAVFDFDEDRNSLTRRFGTKQRWQHAFTSRLSTELLVTFDFTDEGSYSTDEVLGTRVFSKSREVRRYRVETNVQYSPRPWFRTRVLYRQDGDDNYRLTEGGGRTLTQEARTDEFRTGFTIKRKILRTILLDIDVSRTEKVGDRVTSTDRRYFEIRASLEYQPFKKPAKKDNGGGG
ncbi:hypothetical protein K8I85_02270 [bacterium]|nr:hypothetical protein [bacterium]